MDSVLLQPQLRNEATWRRGAEADSRPFSRWLWMSSCISYALGLRRVIRVFIFAAVFLATPALAKRSSPNPLRRPSDSLDRSLTKQSLITTRQ